ncbi:hypothetical protein F4808DRAFT_192308 [Astrocystis sublimbata]|nr:hypothetical protein F4808DRAFT_192308 [Astrocystis sublimbata]
MPGSHDQRTTDALANLSVPPNPSDLSDPRISSPGSTSPTQLAAGGAELMASSPTALGSMICDNDDEDKVVDHHETLPIRDKGKAPEAACLSSAAGSRLSMDTESHEQISSNLQHAQSLTEPLIEGAHLKPSADLSETVDQAESPESSSRTAQLEAQGASCNLSVPLEATSDRVPPATTSALEEQGMSWKQKQKQKSQSGAETGPSSETPDEEPSFQPLCPGDVGWEKSAGRSPKKLPIRFRDAVGRNYVFPWEKAKTWEGMSELVKSCFVHVDIVGPHVQQGHYDLSINLPFAMDFANEILPPGTPLAGPTTQASTSAAETLSSPSSSSTTVSPNGSNSVPQQQQVKSSFVVLPELWEDTIEPGMLVAQHMWPLTPSFVPQPAQPSPPQPHHHHHHHPAVPGPPRGRGAPRGRGWGRGGPPPPPHIGSRPPFIIVNADPPVRGKTMKRQHGR